MKAIARERAKKNNLELNPSMRMSGQKAVMAANEVFYRIKICRKVTLVKRGIGGCELSYRRKFSYSIVPEELFGAKFRRML